MFSNTLKYKRLLKVLKEIYSVELNWKSKNDLFESYYVAKKSNQRIQNLKEFNSCLEDSAYTKNLLLQEVARLIHIQKFDRNLDDNEVEECCGMMQPQEEPSSKPIDLVHTELALKLTNIESMLAEIKMLMGSVGQNSEKHFYLENMASKLKSQHRKIKESINS
jgi:hypothetical protein